VRFVLQDNDTRGLRHGLDHQYPRHDRPPGKMALKKIIIDRHVLNTDTFFPALDLDHAVDEQKGVPVRQYLHDIIDADLITFDRKRRCRGLVLPLDALLI